MLILVASKLAIRYAGVMRRLRFGKIFFSKDVQIIHANTLACALYRLLPVIRAISDGVREIINPCRPPLSLVP